MAGRGKSKASLALVDLPERIDRYGGQVQIERVALTEQDHHLPYFEAGTKKADPRHQWFVRRFGQRCWELDALPPPDTRSRVAQAIESHLDLDTWERCVEVEAAERESMHQFFDGWRARIGGAA